MGFGGRVLDRRHRNLGSGRCRRDPGADDDAGAVTVRKSLSMLKHENRVQNSVELYYDHPDPRECESIEELLSIHLRVPNGNYRETQESFVETCEAFAAYYGEDPKT